MKKAIGVDLGTTNSVIAFKDTGVKIIRNRENEELTRSCVGLQNGEIIVGRTAYQLLKRDPINTILSVKRLMGGAIKDKMVQKMLRSSYYKFGIASLKRGTEDAVAVVLGGKQYTPEQISSEILKKLKEDAELILDDEVTHAVITVPAYFTEKQRNATRIAAQLAGLKVQQLLAEPTAAAIAYGVDNLKMGDSKTVMIYDFGGGTFDLSILNIVDGQYMEAGTGGDRWLGGDNLDEALQGLILEKISSQYPNADINKLISELPDRKRYQFEGQFRDVTEQAKIQLSSSKTTNIIMDGFEDENGDWIDFDLIINREEFEKLITPSIERSIELILTLLKEVGYEMTMIDNILLVGGTSCIPLVKQMLSEKFGAEKIIVSEKPMLAVAEGAAILSHRLGDEYEAPINGEAAVGEISYSTNHNYFIKLKDQFHRIIEKQMPLPANKQEVLKTTVNNQKIVKVHIYSDVEDGNMEHQTLGFFTIEEDLPLGSDIVFDVTLGIGELFEIMVYPKSNKSKSKNIVLGRGVRDSKALEFFSQHLEKIMDNEFSEQQRDFFFKSAKKVIDEVNSLGTESSDSEKWDAIGTNTFSAFEQAERLRSDIDQDEMTLVFAALLLGEYPDLIQSEDAAAMRRYLGDAKNQDDPLLRIQASQKLKTITDDYFVLITLFTVKLASDNVAKINPADGHNLLKMHDQIVNHFRNRRKDEAYVLLEEATALRDKYDQAGDDLRSIYLKK